LRNNWNLPRQKLFWIHYDEKWFFGLFNRANAKLLDCLGLEKFHPYLYHKNHIVKVMVIAFTAFAFDLSIDNGGHGIKLGFFRCCAARLAKRNVCVKRQIGQPRVLIKEKGKPHLVDCYNFQ